MPRFKVETTLSLNDYLKKLGIIDAFRPGKADFSGITGNRELFIGNVIHKVYIDVRIFSVYSIVSKNAFKRVHIQPLEAQAKKWINSVSQGTIKKSRCNLAQW